MIEPRPLSPDDVPWLDELLPWTWSDLRIVSRGVVHVAAELESIVVDERDRKGVLSWSVHGGALEVVLLHGAPERVGVGAALMRAARRVAEERGCSRLWLITTNANTNAQGFYEHLGMRRVAIHAGSIDAARELKPGIPTHDEHGTPIRDEFEYVWDLG